MREPPGLVIIDLMMTDTDGARVIEVIRSYLTLQTLPVLVLTGYPNSPLAERARGLNVSDILVKAKTSLEEIADKVQRELDARMIH
jgi:CheY-like chemotaxis protein